MQKAMNIPDAKEAVEKMGQAEDNSSFEAG